MKNARVERIEINFESSDRAVATIHTDDTDDSQFKPSDLLPWLAFLISIVALAFSIYQASVSRKHDRLSVTPHLLLSQFGGAEPPFGVGVYVENEGVGPAIIRAIEMSYNGKSLSSMKMLRDAIIDEEKRAAGKLFYTDINPGYYYRVGQRENLIRGPPSQPNGDKSGQPANELNQDTRKAVLDVITRSAEIKIEYCSVYNECYSVCLIGGDDMCQSWLLQSTKPATRRN